MTTFKTPQWESPIWNNPVWRNVIFGEDNWVVPIVWILTTWFWSDTDTWIDTETWNDWWVQRYFTFLDMVDDHYIPNSVVNLSWDWEVSVYAYWETWTFASNRALIASEGVDGFAVYITPSGLILAQLPTTTWFEFIGILGNPIAGQLNKITLKKVWNRITLIANGSLSFKDNLAWKPTFSLRYLGAYGGTQSFYAWVLSDVQVWLWWDSSNGILTHQWNLDWDWNTSTELDSIWSNNLTKANILPSQSVLYTLDEEANPSRWEATWYPTFELWVRRYFTYLDGVDDFYFPDTDIPLNGDYEINFQLYYDLSTITGIDRALSGRATTQANKMSIFIDKSNPSISLQYPLMSGLVYTGFNANLRDKKLNDITLKREWNIVTFTVNGVDLTLNNTNFSPINIYYIWTYAWAYLNWIVSNVNIWDWWTSSTWTLIHSWALDWDWTSPIEVDTVWGNNYNRANIAPTQSVEYTFNKTTVPNQWEADGEPTLPLPN